MNKKILVISVSVILVLTVVMLALVVLSRKADTGNESYTQDVNPVQPETETPTESVSQPEVAEPVENQNVLDVLQGENTVPVWNLILLGPNKDYIIDEELVFDKTEFDGQRIDTRVSEAYTSMADAAQQNGITLYLRSGYRPMSLQKTYYESSINSYMSQGHTQAEATILTDRYYTPPGRSEHHTGLALDIITPEYHRDIHTLDDRFAETEAYAWLIENCNDFGFILRYPQDKSEITGVNFEAWHYRYVGANHAKAITKLQLTLDEYIELLKAEFAWVCTATDAETIKNEMVIFAEKFANETIA